MCNKCDCFINLSSCVGRREKPRWRWLGRRREKERVGETRARKVTFLRFSRRVVPVERPAADSCTKLEGPTPREDSERCEIRVCGVHVVSPSPPGSTSSPCRVNRQIGSDASDETTKGGEGERRLFHGAARVASQMRRDGIARGVLRTFKTLSAYFLFPRSSARGKRAARYRTCACARYRYV